MPGDHSPRDERHAGYGGTRRIENGELTITTESVPEILHAAEKVNASRIIVGPGVTKYWINDDTIEIGENDTFYYVKINGEYTVPEGNIP